MSRSPEDLLYRYARGVDRKDWDLVRSCYHPDAHDDHGAYQGGVEGLLVWLRDRHEAVSLSMHAITNVLVQFVGDDRALSEAYCTTTQRVRDASSEALAMYDVPAGHDEQAGTWETEVRCRFLDQIRRDDREWRIQRRTVVFETLRVTPVMDGSPFGERWSIGSRDEHDPLYRELRTAGADRP